MRNGNLDEEKLRIENGSVIIINDAKENGKMNALYKILYTEHDFAPLEQYVFDYPTKKRFVKLKHHYEKYGMTEEAQKIGQVLESKYK